MGSSEFETKNSSIRQVSPVVKSIIEQLNYPYHILPDQLTAEQVMEEYQDAYDRGKREGFVPVLVPEDDILDEYFGILNDDGCKIEDTLKKIGNNGKELLTKSLEENSLDLDELLGKMEGGGEDNEFISVFDFDRSMKQTILFEVPTKNPWETVAYVPFGGWNDCPIPEDMASICKYWYEKYGAVPAVITHDTLEFLLPKPVPKEEAMETAKEHYLFCYDRVDQCTKSGTIGEVADCIWQSRVWFFWWD